MAADHCDKFGAVIHGGQMFLSRETKNYEFIYLFSPHKNGIGENTSDETERVNLL